MYNYTYINTLHTYMRVYIYMYMFEIVFKSLNQEWRKFLHMERMTEAERLPGSGTGSSPWGAQVPQEDENRATSVLDKETKYMVWNEAPKLRRLPRSCSYIWTRSRKRKQNMQPWWLGLRDSSYSVHSQWASWATNTRPGLWVRDIQQPSEIAMSLQSQWTFK